MKPIIIHFTSGPQRHQQVGDYGENPEKVWFQITDFPGKPAYAMAILIHELWERFRNTQLGITDEAVDAFDLAHQDHDDPGMLPEAPYHKTHLEGDCLERMCIMMAGEDWAEYEAAIAELFKEPSK